jgi:hypothetical protein
MVAGVQKASWISGKSDFILETLAMEAKLQPSAAIFHVASEPEAYFIVTLNAVVRPVFTVALVLMLANPGAATMTV